MNFSSKSATHAKNIFSFETLEMSVDQRKTIVNFSRGVKFSFCNFFGYYWPLALILVEKKFSSTCPAVLVDF
jgi:hypothetical protein